MREALIYLIVFAMTMYVAFRGERKTKVHKASDSDEFEGRMIVIAVALVLFIAFELLVRWIFKNYFP